MLTRSEDEKYIGLVNQIGLQLFEITDPEQVFDVFLKTVVSMTGMEMAAIHAYNKKTGRLEIIKSIGVPQDIYEAVLDILPNEGVSGKAFSESSIIFYNRNAKDNPAISVVPDKIGTMMAIPVKFMDITIGVLAVASQKIISIKHIDNGFMENITRYIGGMVEHVRQSNDLVNKGREGFYNRKVVENIVQDLPSGVIYMDTRGKVLLFNPVMEQITGIKSRDIINKPVDVFIKQIKLSGFDYADVVKNEVVKKRMNSFGILPDGRDIYFGFTIAPVKNANNKVEGVIAIFADLTQVKRMEEEQRRMSHLAMIGEMSARLAHEIKNPLASIIIGIQLFKKRHPDDADSRYLDMIISEIQRIDDLVKDLLTYSKSSVPHMTRVNVVEVIKNVLNILAPQFEHHNIQINQNINAGVGTEIIVDEAAIHQAIMNIVSNAIDAMPKGGTITVKVGTQKANKKIIIENDIKYEYPEQEFLKVDIHDTGTGIEEAYLDKIYTPFFSTKAQGTGLGLSIVKNIIEENMAKITVSSSKDKGTTFSLLFLKGERKKCFEIINCPKDEKEKCEAYLRGDTYRCFKYRDLLTGCCGIKCINCKMYTRSVIIV
jgi:PAS domain S-box-containing protein